MGRERAAGDEWGDEPNPLDNLERPRGFDGARRHPDAPTSARTGRHSRFSPQLVTVWVVPLLVYHLSHQLQVARELVSLLPLATVALP